MWVSQADITQLVGFRAGLMLDRIDSRITREYGNGKGFRLTISRMEDIAKELAIELPFIRSRAKVSEIRAFSDFVARKRRIERQSLLRTLTILSRMNLSSARAGCPMNPMDRANWQETEGCISATFPGENSSFGAQLVVSQSEEAPIRDFAAGCFRDGVGGNVYKRRIKNGFEYIFRIRRLSHIALEISAEIPYLRTRKALKQVEEFAEFLNFPRKRVSNNLELARKALTGGPVV